MTASASQTPVQSDQQILTELEQDWNDAFYRKDVAFIEKILTDEFIATYQVDRRLRSHSWSALRWNSAFWDERRWLPVVRLRQHVSLVGARNPDEGKAALAALARDDLSSPW